MKEDQTRIDISKEGAIAEAAEAARSIAAIIGMGSTMQYMVATATSELATNIHRYAGHGSIAIAIISSGGRQGIEIIASDNGPGISDLKSALLDNFSTSGSLGVGLPGTKRMMDHFDIESTPGKGTRIMIRKWLEKTSEI